jgi:hypothetical protein
MNKIKLLEYVSPDGELIYNPNLDDLGQLILSPQKDYWCSGSGEGCLTWYDENNISSITSRNSLISLVLTFSEKYGFWLLYSCREEQQTFISIGDGDFSHKNAVEVYICGDPLLLPSAYFISPDFAFIAAKEFGKTGNKTERVKWISQGEDGWDYGDPEGFV